VRLLPLLLCVGAPAYAGDCTISLSGMNFGSYDPIERSTPLDSAGSVNVACNPTTLGEALFGVYVDIAFGTGSSGSYAARTLRQPPSSVLQYNLYTTAARTTVWGNGAGGTQTVGGAVGGLLSGQPSPRTFPVYGRIPPLQDPGVGVHGDTVIVTVTF
jgi:spore coat protein U-like protein